MHREANLSLDDIKNAASVAGQVVLDATGSDHHGARERLCAIRDAAGWYMRENNLESISVEKFFEICRAELKAADSADHNNASNHRIAVEQFTKALELHSQFQQYMRNSNQKNSKIVK